MGLSVLSSYVPLLRIGSARRMLAVAFLGRAPTGVLGLSAIVFLHQQGRSYAVAGVVGGAIGLGIALSAVIQARLVGRWGNRSLVVAASGHLLLGVITVLGVLRGWPTFALAVIGFAFGSSLPATSSIIRGLYPGLVPDRPDLHSTAFALDAALTDASYVAGPAFVAFTVALGSPGIAIGLAIIAALIAVVVMLRMDSLSLHTEDPQVTRALPPHNPAPVRLLVCASFPVGFSWGIYDVAFPAYATSQHDPPMGGILLALVSLASVCGSLSYGAVSARIAASSVLIVGSLLYPAAFALPLFGTTLLTMCLLAIPSGLANGPWVAARNHFLNTTASRELRAAVNAWALLAVYLGTAAGQAVGGVVVTAGDWRAGAAIAWAGIALIPILAVTARGSLRARAGLQPSAETRTPRCCDPADRRPRQTRLGDHAKKRLANRSSRVDDGQMIQNFGPTVSELLDRPLVAQISTVSPAGLPQASLVWFERRGAQIVIFSQAEAPKVRNLRHNPHIDFVVVDPDRELGAGTPLYLRLSGTAEITVAEPGIHHRLAKRYGHPRGYPAEFGDPGELVNIHMTVLRISGLSPEGGWQSR